MNTSLPPEPNYPRLALASTSYVAAIYITLLIASTINADGLRSVHPAFSTRIPFHWIGSLVGLKRLDLATVVAAVIVGASFYCLDRSLRDHLLVGAPVHRDLHIQRNREMCSTLGIVLLVLDATFFFFGLLRPSGWLAPSLVGAVVLTALYVALLLAMTYLNIVLWLKPERN